VSNLCTDTLGREREQKVDKKLEITLSGVDPTKLCFLRFFFFGIKLGRLTIN
jgi:hypothetical protein